MTFDIMAPDGRMYDKDGIRRDVFAIEAEIIQYMRPNGERVRNAADVGLRHAQKSREMVITAEVLPTGHISLCVRKKTQPEERERTFLAHNCAGDGCCKRDPTTVLKKAIDEVMGK